MKKLFILTFSLLLSVPALEARHSQLFNLIDQIGQLPPSSNQLFQYAIEQLTDFDHFTIHLCLDSRYYGNLFLTTVAQKYFGPEFPIHGVEINLIKTIKHLDQLSFIITTIINQDNQLNTNKYQLLLTILGIIHLVIPQIKEELKTIKNNPIFLEEEKRMQQHKLFMAQYAH